MKTTHSDIITLYHLWAALQRRLGLFIKIVVIFAVLGLFVVLFKPVGYVFTQRVQLMGYYSASSASDDASSVDSVSPPLVKRVTLQNSQDVIAQLTDTQPVTVVPDTDTQGKTIANDNLTLRVTDKLSRKQLALAAIKQVIKQIKANQLNQYSLQRTVLMNRIQQDQAQLIALQRTATGMLNHWQDLSAPGGKQSVASKELLGYAKLDSRLVKSDGLANVARLMLVQRANDFAVDYQTKIFNLKRSLEANQHALDTLKPSHAQGALVVSAKPVGLHKSVLFLLTLLLGVVVAFFTVLFAEFSGKPSSGQNEQ